jgi:ssDNA-binding Zn-finger/Zn-ribbon topoisomerase 1
MNRFHDARRQLGCIVMIATLFLSAGGHLALLQGVAWVTMLKDFSRAGSLTAAVEKTFDGKHPCPMCKKIAAQRTHDEKAPVTVKAEKKAEVFVKASGSELPSPVSRPFAYGPAPFVLMPERFSAPPVPVPIVSAS